VNPLFRFCSSSIGRKWIVALTGLVLFGFVIGHLIGNLQVFLGSPEPLNRYGAFLQGLGELLWAIRFFLDHEGRVRDRALFDLAIDSKLRGCDLVKIKIGDLVAGPEIRMRAIVVQQKTGRPVQFELTNDVRASLLAWLRGAAVQSTTMHSRAGLTRRTT